jgi:hypothetical protein
MFTSLDSQIPVAAETGSAPVSRMTRGWIDADVALAGRTAP